MTTVQLRDQVIERIYGINSQEYLLAIKKILDMGKQRDEIYHLNDAQKDLIRQGKQQISNGEFVSNEELEQEEDTWLNG